MLESLARLIARPLFAGGDANPCTPRIPIGEAQQLRRCAGTQFAPQAARCATVATVSRPSLTAPAAATAGLLVPLAVLDRHMQSAGGVGMIPFELAGPDRSAEILRTWGAEGQRAARASLLLDFPFLVAYTALNVRLTERACDALTAQGASPLTTIARAVAAVQVVAGVCDAVENAALLSVITREGDARLSALARSASRAKFAGLIVGWLYSAAVVLALRRAA